MNFFSFFDQIGIAGLFDILFMSFFIYVLLVWFTRTRAAFVLTGISIVAVFYLLTRQFNMVMTATVFERFFAVILIALVVIFQEELRYFFERVAVWSLNRGLRRKKNVRLTRKETEVLVRTLTDFAREKVGALLVLRGRDMLFRHLDGGIELNGQMSEPLLKSIFDPHSAGHDGAVVIDSDRITQFSAHLPLSKNLKKIGKGGTRHAAALGLSELTDALCIVVSEERGALSVARRGNIQVVSDAEELDRMLESFYEEIYPKRQNNWQDFFKKQTREKILAVISAVLLWFVLVEGAKTAYRTITVPVIISDLPAGWAVQEVDPSKIVVTFQGLKRNFYFMRKEQIQLSLQADLKEGDQRVWISNGDFLYPESISIQTVIPRDIRVRLKKTEAEVSNLNQAA